MAFKMKNLGMPAAALALAATLIMPSSAEAADGKSILDLFQGTRGAIAESNGDTQPNQIDPRISFPFFEIAKGVRLTISGRLELTARHQKFDTRSIGLSVSF